MALEGKIAYNKNDRLTKGGANVHKILPNLLFVLIIFILATAFPLSTDILTLNLSQQIIDQPVDVVTPVTQLSLEFPTTEDTILAESITFTIENTHAEFPADFLEAYTLQIIRPGETDTFKTYKLSDLNFEITEPTPIQRNLVIDKSQLLEVLPKGYYQIQLVEAALIHEYSWYATNMTYEKQLLATSNTITNNQMAFTLFYPTQDYKLTIPVTRFVSLPDNRWRALYTHLTNGPVETLGLTPLKPALPFAPNIRIASQNANIYLYEANLLGFEQNIATIFEAITKSFMTLGPLEGVNFYVNDRNQGTFAGIDLSTTHTYSRLNEVYLGYNHESDYMLLYPYALSEENFDARIEEIITLLKNPTGIAEDLIPSLPIDVELLEYALVGDTLTLTFSDAFANSLQLSDAYVDLMIKSMLYSFTSMPEVQSVTFSGNFSHPAYDFSAPLKPDVYINLEP